MKKAPRIAILGAGIMGSSLALNLARKGAEVTLFDKKPKPFLAASRWNEGKIHMGYLYAADSSLCTAKHIIPGGLKFRSLVEELLETSIEPFVTKGYDTYLCHRDSIVCPDTMYHYMQDVTSLLKESRDLGNYFSDFSIKSVEKLKNSDLEHISNSDDIVAGFKVPEYSVETNWIADQFTKTLQDEKKISLQMDAVIESVSRTKKNKNTEWNVHTSDGTFSSYDYVVNALWEGRMSIDQTVDIMPQGIWSNRYRQSLFVRTSKVLDVPSVIIGTGPFGDIKNYNGRNFYLSWYPLGLRVDSTDISPLEPALLDVDARKNLSSAIFDQLEDYFPWVKQIQDCAEEISLEGGWVFAAGRGKLSNPTSSLHKRSDYAISRYESYFSIDTGKYSTAPFLAKNLADEIMS